ncbi:multidrug resistance efflux transporter family protein [Kordia sp. YSTF-M3]|uniref:Multidrug resistance efflux transporter family protein n=1 Tax=Kordia aestuariivivens TaxID=2759037 RepID=A0ABR7Q4T5_9FLAO|nr:multidrug resistance efflux transporter family protein [Kordia aestuariivivens]MBC8753572.1 multidrug resistance efflux transporter family protein [Kordia aestuariivivens]
MKIDTIYSKILLYGFLAALFFSSTFAINKWLNVEMLGHWYWTASLRYIYVFLLINIIILIKNGSYSLLRTYKCYFQNILFWNMAGGIGFGIFYLCLCYAASYSDGWVLASTWQTTILFTPVVLFLLKERIKLHGVLYLIVMFIGVLLINNYAFKTIDDAFFNSIIPILIAAFSYPLGNTLCKFACEGKYEKISIHKYGISKDPLNQILIMVLGALPLIFIVGFIVNPTQPTIYQLKYIFIIAILTGVIATYFLYKARKIANKDGTALAFADGTQSIESPLALFWGFILFNEQLPNLSGWIGLILLTLGMGLFYLKNIKRQNNSIQNQKNY